MRNLQKDLAICNKATPGPWESVRAAYEDCLVLNDEYSLSKHDIKFITTSREGWPHAIERAIKAEAEVNEWQDVAEQRLESYLVVTQKVCRLEAENAKLRKVADAARGVFLGEGEHLCSEFEDAMDRLEQSLAELDKEGER